MVTVTGLNAQGQRFTQTIDDALAATRASAATKRRLTAYISTQANALRKGGITVSGVPVGTDALGIAYILGASDKAASDPTFTTPFVVSPTLTVTLNSAQIVAIKDAVQNFINAMFAAEAEANAGLQAGTVATQAEVDAIFAAVSRSF
jgi:hypothetical protein